MNADEKREALVARRELIEGLLLALDQPDAFVDQLRRSRSQRESRQLLHDALGVSELVADHVLDAPLGLSLIHI